MRRIGFESSRQLDSRVLTAVFLGIAFVVAAATNAAAIANVCPGDCDGDGEVTVDEILRQVSIALGESPASLCFAGDMSCDSDLTVDEILTAVGGALAGCDERPRGTLVVPASQPVGVVRETAQIVIGGTPVMPPQYAVADPPEAVLEDFATGLAVPWAMEFAPDGRLFVSERDGRIRVVEEGVLLPQPWATVAVEQIGEGGLLGLALHPEFPSEPYVYVCHTLRVDGVVQNRIIRIREEGGQGGAEEEVFAGIPGNSVHDGCRLRFGPDGMLYATTGDAAQRALAQDVDSFAGKILRMRPDGAAPGDNPFGPASYVYSLGHRNPQGLTFRPGSGELWASEHGPSFEVGVGAHDEINLIEAGVNYGWPEVVGAPGFAGLRDPVLTYPNAPVPPAGMTFYQGGEIPAWGGDLFFATLGSTHLQRVGFDACGRIALLERLYAGELGRLRDVIEGPDGALYLATSNRDGRGNPGPNDDRIIRIGGVTGGE